MKRKIYNTLLEWKAESQGETAILIDGARRVGKSYIVREFAQRVFDNTTKDLAKNILGLSIFPFLGNGQFKSV